MGLSFDELNRMTMEDFLDLCDMWAFDPDDDDVIWPATQADIDRFF